MTADTVYLDVSVITPLPKRDMFDYYFVKADIPDDDMERARKNLERERLKGGERNPSSRRERSRVSSTCSNKHAPTIRQGK